MTWSVTRVGAALVAVLMVTLAVVAVIALHVSGTAFDSSPSGVAPSVGQDPSPPIDRTPQVRIAVAGDTGTGDAKEYATAREMAAQGRHLAYDALVLLGDLVYEHGDADRVDEAVTDPFAPVLESGAELLPALGNHDYQSGEQRRILALLGRSRSWYVERVGPVRVVVLDSERVDDLGQTRWLRQVLAAPQPAGTWTIAAMHHPAYSAGKHGSTHEVQDAWVPLFEQYDVPLVLAGHDHDYQRSVPIRGVTYVVSGGAAKLRDTGREEFTAVSTSILHYLDLLVYRDRIVGRAIDHHGRLVDAFTLTR